MKFLKQFPAALLCAVLLYSSLIPLHAGDVAKTDAPWLDKTSPYGIEKRTLWTTSKVIGAPEPPPPYKPERVFTSLRFDRPLDLANSPDNQRWFVCEDPGLIYSFKKDPAVERADLFLDIRRKDHRYLNLWEQRRIWGITFHPEYSSNGYIYVSYIDPRPTPARVRISRFTVKDRLASPPVADGDSEHIITEWISAVDHHGGCMRFGKDGYLYFSTGDGSATSDGNNTGQDISDFNAAIMRIDVNKIENGKAYAIPADNPFAGVPGARGEVWAYGLRNVWKMNFDRETGDLWAGDVGQDLRDMICKVEKGGNYGWSITEGTRPFLPERKRGPTPILPPVIEHDHEEVRSITGGFVYRGTRLKELTGTYIYADYETGRIFGLRYDGKQATEKRELASTTIKPVCFGEDKDGELFILDYQGAIFRLVPNPPPAEPLTPFPAKLSETGLFSATKGHVPAPGMIPYDVNSPLWSDGAIKYRFIALPKETKIDYDENNAWRFPEGAVLVKSFALEMETGKPASTKLLETRLLHFERGQWHFYTYLWNEEQTDAFLQGKQGSEKTYEIVDAAAPDGRRSQTWQFPSRAQCTMCHTQAAGPPLGLHTSQMNKPVSYGNVKDNQIRAFDKIGLFSQRIADMHKPRGDNPARVPRLANPLDKEAGLDDRARSYLQVNCSHCHRIWGGGNSPFNLVYTTPLDATLTINATVTHGDFGLTDPRVISPGAPERSMLLFRMNKTGQGRMPHIASSVIDAPAVELIREWISKMPPKE